MRETTSDVTTTVWEIEIARNGIWPTCWTWTVWKRESNPSNVDLRTGFSLTKDRARRKALKAKRSMEEDDVRVIYS